MGRDKMLKFKGHYDEHPTKDDFDNYKRVNNAYSIPTVDDVYEVIAPMISDTVLQILKGQGIYWGYECETHSDNEIHIAKIDNMDFTPTNRVTESKNANGVSSKAEKFDRMIHRLRAKSIPKEEKKLASILHRSLKIGYDEAHRRAKLLLSMPNE
jgi:hypothetical protein